MKKSSNLNLWKNSVVSTKILFIQNLCQNNIYQKQTCTSKVLFITRMLWQMTWEKKGQVILWRNPHFPSQVVMTINLFHLIESSRAYSFQEYMYYPTNYLLVSIFTNFLQGLGFWYSKRDSLLKILYLLRLLLRYRKTKCQLNMA